MGSPESETMISTAYISASANRFSRAADSSESSLIAFGTSNLIALWQSNADNGIEQTLPGHEGQVTCVRFSGDAGSFYSADDRGALSQWKLVDGKWTRYLSVKAHNQAICALAIREDCVATGSSDATIKIWNVKQDDGEGPKELQTIGLKGRYPLDIQLSHLPESECLIMAVASTNRTVSIWTRSTDTFLHATTLFGHDDWVKSLAFQTGVAAPNILTLASGSQDGTIRLWNIEHNTKPTATAASSTLAGLTDELLDSFEASLGEVADGEEGGRQISLKRHVITVRSSDGSLIQYSITFDALLIGHDAGVTSVCWRPSSSTRPAALLSSSTDSSVILWSQTSVSKGQDSASIWVSQQRFGDVGGQRLGGFVGCLFSENGNNAAAWGWGGGWRSWRSQVDQTGSETWSEVGAISGHRGIVRGVSWSPGGEYLISTGPDQTTRIHAPVNGNAPLEQQIWHEICRPQVHGYDLNQAVFLSPLRFVSVADEKVARVFEAPKSFVSLAKHCGILDDTISEEERPVGASVPPLGLSNKALEKPDATDNSPLPTGITNMHRRPFEGELALSTLWPEIEKVFGHGYELYTVAASNSRKLVATVCKASSAEHAVVRLYDTEKWKPFGEPLQGHELTVTRIAFSPDDQHILTVSRDRTFCLFELADGGYQRVRREVAHARIVWDCGWSPDGTLFATASRDKSVKIWALSDKGSKKWTPIQVIKAQDAATAVAFQQCTSTSTSLAIGFEKGNISVYDAVQADAASFKERVKINAELAHVAQITRLEWRPNLQRDDVAQLASCSEDGTIRLFHIKTSP